MSGELVRPVYARVIVGRGNRWQLVAIDTSRPGWMPGMSGALKAAGMRPGDFVRIEVSKGASG